MAALGAARRIVVKIGSALLVDRDTGGLKADWLAALAEDVAHLRGRGQDVVLVSSGSIALGRGVLGMPAEIHGRLSQRPRSQRLARVRRAGILKGYTQNREITGSKSLNRLCLSAHEGQMSSHTWQGC